MSLDCNNSEPLAIQYHEDFYVGPSYETILQGRIFLDCNPKGRIVNDKKFVPNGNGYCCVELNSKQVHMLKQSKNKIENFVIRLRYSSVKDAEWIDDLECISESNSLTALKAPWKTALSLQSITKLKEPKLTKDDHKLISNWSKPDASGYWKNAMISARKAEVAALELYRNLYKSAKDLSILQVTSQDDNQWESADIETDRRWIDVKNARYSFSSRSSRHPYSEHCVPQFKLDRNNCDVSISSFLSPYRKNNELIVWLGETTLGQIEKLQAEFNSEYLQVTLPTRLNNNFLPAWLFDYPWPCYKERDDALSQIQSPEFSFPSQEFNISSKILANQSFSSKTDGTLGLEAIRLKQRIERCGLTRAVLFLHILDRFCHISLEDKAFKDTGLNKILFPDSIDDKRTPLAVYDPLKTIWNLWRILVKVSEKCLREARCFTSFQLKGPNILKAGNGDGNEQTIFAYCGGWKTSDNGTPVRCGQNPIYLGQDKLCSTCGYLICHQCGFSPKNDCPECMTIKKEFNYGYP